MSKFDFMFESPAVHQFGWALIDSLWEGALVAFVLAGVLLVLRQRGPQARYLASCAAMLCLFASPIMTFVLLGPGSAPKPALTADETTVAPTEGEPSGPAAETPRSEPTDGDLRRDAARARGQMTAAAPGLVKLSSLPDARSVSLERRPLDFLQLALPWLVLTWAAGVIGMSLWNIGGWVAVQRLQSLATGPAAAPARETADRLCKRLGLHGSVRLLKSALIESPLVIGVIRPAILLPVSLLSGLPSAQLESILAHELAHIRRHDYLVNLIQSIVETILFYHPAVWWVSRRIRIERENCCDDIALGVTQDRVEYVRALAAVAATRLPALAPAAAGGVLLARVRRVLNLPDHSSRSGSWIAGITSLALCAIVALVIAAPVRDAVQARANATPAPATTQAVDPANAAGPALELTVTDQQSRKPIAAVSVRPLINGTARELITDDAGHVRIPLPQGTVYMNLLARKDAYVPTMVVWNSSRKPDPVPLSYTLALEPGTSIGGEVVDEHGNPVANATVSLWIDRPGDDAEPRVTAHIYDLPETTDGAGRWHCDVVPREVGEVGLRLSHPDFVSDDRYGTSSSPTIQQLRSKTAVSVMQKGIALGGRVVDAGGKPIAGATVALGTTQYGVRSPETRSNNDGRFLLPHCRPQAAAPLIVRATGHAPSMTIVGADKDVLDLVMRLDPPRPLTARVVDPQGKPLSGVRVMAKYWRGVPAFDWDGRTDADGRFTWTEAPSDGMRFGLYLAHYVQLTDQPIAAGDPPPVVTLWPELRVVGTVVDDATGKPIDRFTGVRGWTSKDESNVYWERTAAGGPPAAGIEGRDGKFEFIADVIRDGYAVRIETDGYLPAESKVYHAQDGMVRLNFRLKRSADLAGTLVTPDGKPLSGAQVLVVTPASQILIHDGALGSQTFTLRAEADKKGRFHFPPQSGKYFVLALNEHGFAEFSPEQLAAPGHLVVPPWGRIHGSAHVGTSPAAGMTVSAHRSVALKSDGRPDNDYRFNISDSATVDADGHFVLSHVPTGKAMIAIEVKSAAADGMTTQIGYAQQTHVEVESGKAAEVSLGGMGRPVVGRLVMPPELAGIPFGLASGNSTILGKLHTPKRILPGGWDKMDEQARAKWNEQWRQSPEVKAYDREQENRKYYPVVVRPDGTFRADDVTPGEYELRVSLEDRDTREPGPMTIKTLATGSLDFTVGEMPGGRGDEPLDLGPVELAAPKR